jgi:hypothetical protein
MPTDEEVEKLESKLSLEHCVEMIETELFRWQEQSRLFVTSISHSPASYSQSSLTYLKSLLVPDLPVAFSYNSSSSFAASSFGGMWA